MSIYSSPFPICGADHCIKFVAERILRFAEADAPGFCKTHGIPFDPEEDRFRDGVKLAQIRKAIAAAWPLISQSAKKEFLEDQLFGAMAYLAGSLEAFAQSGVPIPSGPWVEYFRPGGLSRTLRAVAGEHAEHAPDNGSDTVD